MTGGRAFTCILIDLDDCLYRVEEVSRQVRENIQRYITTHLDIPQDQVAALTQDLYYGYGTTLAGLLAHGYPIDVDHFHAAVHGSLDYARLLQPDQAVRDIVLSLDCPRYVLTNADHKHAVICLERLGLSDCFHGVFDYERVQELAHAKGLLSREKPLLCKPSPACYELVMGAVGAEPASTIFLDDSMRNIAAAHELGIFSVLVGREGPAVAGADACIPHFAALPCVAPQLFQGREEAQRQRRQSEEGAAVEAPTIQVPA